MVDLKLYESDLIYKNGDFETTDYINDSIANQVAIWVSTNFNSYIFDENVGINIKGLRKIKEGDIGNANSFFIQELEYIVDYSSIITIVCKDIKTKDMGTHKEIYFNILIYTNILSTDRNKPILVEGSI